MRQKNLLLIPIVLGIVGLVFAFTIPGTFQCQGTSDCFSGTIIDVPGPRTILVDNIRVHLAMIDVSGAVPSDAIYQIRNLCAVGSTVLVDQDDSMASEVLDSELTGVVYCNGRNLNLALVESPVMSLDMGSCGFSEFADTTWAKKHGC